MKKALYGTTALVAAGLSAGQAMADGGIKLGISGYYRASAGILIGGDQAAVSVHNKTAGGGTTTSIGGLGDFGRTSGGFRQEIRINFKGGFTLPDGITVEAFVGLNPGSTNANTTETRLNRAYVDFKGQYGDLRFGAGDSLDAIKEDCVYDPGNVTSNFGINSANQDFTNAGLANFGSNVVGVATFETAAATCLTFVQKGTSIAYFSPSFAGFTLALSYTPSGGTNNTSGSQGFGAGTDFKNNQADNILSVAGDYNGDLGGGWTLLVGGGGQWAFSGHTSGGGTQHNKPSAYALGFQVANPNGWTFGASGEYVVNYQNFNGVYIATDAGTGGADGWIGAVGVAYTVGNWSFGAQGIYSRYQVHQGSPSAGHDAIWGVGVNGAYSLGAGVTLEGQVAYSKYDPAVGTPSSTNPMAYDAVELDAGIAINF